MRLRQSYISGQSPMPRTAMQPLALRRGAIHCGYRMKTDIQLIFKVHANGMNHENTSEEAGIESLPCLVFASSILAACDPAWASMEASYSPEQGSETLKNVAGIGYIILVIFYFFRLFKKRAEKAASEPLSSNAKGTPGQQAQLDKGETAEDLSALDREQTVDTSTPGDVSVLQCAIGVAQAGTICFLFYLLSRVVDDYFAHQNLPSQYTARNITLLIQSVVRGLVYLVTFIFGANATGLAALAVQLVIDPEGVDRGLDQPRPKPEKLPKVKVTDDMGSIKRAFKEAERMGRDDAKK